MKKETPKILISFFVNLSLIVFMFISAIYIGVFSNNKYALEKELHNRARSIVNSFILARNWNAAHGGVYVEKTPGMQSNPYLENPDIEAKDGRVFTKKNPALMLREISETAEIENGFAFRLTSLKTLNPGNVPDPFEKSSLERFESGDKETFLKEHLAGSTFFRYMAPLYAEESCLQCHPGYNIGDVRGGISVRFNIDEVEAALRQSTLVTIGLAIVTIFLLLTIIYRLVMNLYERLRRAETRLREMAVTDELTGLKNRRYLIERLGGEFKLAQRNNTALSCISFDLDHFKKINDTHGHDAGDRVLREIGILARKKCRTSDIVCRFGGEEFIILLPGTSTEGAMRAAEKLREAITLLRIAIPAGADLSVSASFGVACYGPEFSGEVKDMEGLLKRVDEALYKAKTNGRNRVEMVQKDDNTHADKVRAY